ncbi:MAG: hypothetical protein R3B95_21340, partial [Nitrospirales bacterium]|nr:hypothetical protein [Nitrospirales bacterium]
MENTPNTREAPLPFHLRLLTGPGWTLLFPGRPCPNLASWSALHIFASAFSGVVRQGVIGFGYFCSTTTVTPFGTHQAKARLPRRNPATNNCHSTTMATSIVSPGPNSIPSYFATSPA